MKAAAGDDVGQAAGVLSNDWSGRWPGLSAVLIGGPSYGTLTLNANGGLTYTPQSGFAGMDCFTYEATDGTNNYGTAMVTIEVTQTGGLFNDDFTRCDSRLSPWQVNSGSWTITSGTLQGSSSLGSYGYCYLTNSWTDYSVQADIQFPAGAYGGGLGWRLNSTNGAHYAAWIYPEGSPGGSNLLKLVRFAGWQSWSPLATQLLASVGITNHTIKLAFNGNYIEVYYDDLTNPVISATDTNQGWFSSGSVSLDMWTDEDGPDYLMTVGRVIVTP